MEQANEWEVGGGVASTLGNGLVPLGLVKREVENRAMGKGNGHVGSTWERAIWGQGRTSWRRAKLLKGCGCDVVAEMSEEEVSDVMDTRTATRMAGGVSYRSALASLRGDAAFIRNAPWLTRHLAGLGSIGLVLPGPPQSPQVFQAPATLPGNSERTHSSANRSTPLQGRALEPILPIPGG